MLFSFCGSIVQKFPLSAEVLADAISARDANGGNKILNEKDFADDELGLVERKLKALPIGEKLLTTARY